MNSYRRLLAFLRPYRSWVAGGLVAAAISSAAAALYAQLTGPLLKAVLTAEGVDVWGLHLEGPALLRTLPVLLLGVALAKASAQLLQGGLMQTVGQHVVRDLRRALYQRLLALPPSFFEARHSGELLSRFSADVAQVEFAIAQALGSYVKDTLQVLALLGVCLWTDARLFLFAFVVLPAAVIPVSRFAKALKRVARTTQSSLGALTELTAEQLHNLSVVQGYRGLLRSLERFDAEQDRYLGAMRRSLFIRGAFTPTLEVMGMVGVALALFFGARAVSAEPALAAKLVSFLAATLLMYQPLKALSGTFSLVVQGVGAAERLFEITDAQAEHDEGAPAGPLRQALELEGVRLRYADGREALTGLTLRVPAGRKVALVGASGAGKSTVFSLLLRAVDAQAGQVRWDGQALEGLARRTVRAQVGWVPQEPVLFSGTVRENVLLGRPGAGELELWAALRRAHAEAFVRGLPAGLDEPVGERGARLSGGQRQRLAIARAFLREPSVLLLDEPTSALDAASESEVQAGLRELMAGRTTLVIAHRLATVRDADWICVLEAGQLVEEGTHDALVARQGRYAALLAQGEVKAA